MPEGIEVRPLESLDDARDAAALIDRIWGERRIVSPALIRAMATHGGQVLGAFRGGEMVGAQMGLVGLSPSGPVLHSHITGVAPEAQRAGVGFLLKRAQRDWCLERGIHAVTWTFDPLVARNARFNLRKLGAVAERFHRDYYGPMEDAFNRGDRSDRLEVRWDLRSARVEAAMAGRPGAAEPAEARTVLDDRDGRPVRGDARDAARLIVRIPDDYHALRERDRDAGRAWREAAGDALEEAMDRGYRAVDFVRPGGYLLERT